MSTQQGVVKWAGGKVLKGRTYFSFNLVDVDGFYRCGTKDPKVNKGDAIEFSYEDDPDWGPQVDIKSITFQSKAEASTVATTSTGVGGAKSVGRDEYWANKEAADVDRQKIISLQAATNTATTIITAALAAEALTLPAAKGAKLDALVAMVYELTDELVVRYTTAPAHVDELVENHKREIAEVAEGANYGGEMSDE